MLDQDWTAKQVLVTGAGGFIGSHLVERLVEAGAQVRAFVRYNSLGSTGLLRELPGPLVDDIDIVHGDLRNAEAVSEAVQDMDCVFHLGASISIPYSYISPRDVVEDNILGTLNVLSAVREGQRARCILTSTSEVYGTAQYVPIDEGHPLQGQSPYAASKIGADKLAESFYRSYSTPVVTVRPFNTYGPRQSTRAVIPATIGQILAAGEIKIGNCHTSRDFVFVDDTVEGFMRLAQCDGAVGQVVNVGTGKETKIEALIELIVQRMGREMAVEQVQERMRPAASEVDRLLADNGKLHKLLGWKPEVGIEEGVTKTIAWMRGNYCQRAIEYHV